MTEIGFHSEPAKKTNFYEDNIGNAVNLFCQDGITHSGDLDSYDLNSGKIILTNTITRVYLKDGSSEIVESSSPLEIECAVIVRKQATTREDRLGRIANYNRDLILEETQKQKTFDERLKSQSPPQPIILITGGNYSKR